jgi:hypothetical protein
MQNILYNIALLSCKDGDKDLKFILKLSYVNKECYKRCLNKLEWHKINLYLQSQNKEALSYRPDVAYCFVTNADNNWKLRGRSGYVCAVFAYEQKYNDKYTYTKCNWDGHFEIDHRTLDYIIILISCEVNGSVINNCIVDGKLVNATLIITRDTVIKYSIVNFNVVKLVTSIDEVNFISSPQVS